MFFFPIVLYVGVFFNFFLGRGKEGYAQVDEAAIQRLALLDDVILLKKLLEGEALLVQHQLR